jgi:hypothetical protein
MRQAIEADLAETEGLSAEHESAATPQVAGACLCLREQLCDLFRPTRPANARAAPSILSMRMAMKTMPSVSVFGLVPVPPPERDARSEQHVLPPRDPCEIARRISSLRPMVKRLATKAEITRIRDELKAIGADCMKLTCTCGWLQRRTPH